MKSSYYDTSVEIGKLFQENNKAWNGSDTFKYHKQIKDLVKKYDCHTALDYGCGKGTQWHTKRVMPLHEEELTFEDYLGINEVTLYDPCVPAFSTLPSDKFDIVICSQVLGSVPDADMTWVKDTLQSLTNKVCFIGLIDPSVPPKSKKMIYDLNFFKDKRSVPWYLDKFSSWEGSQLYWWFRVEGILYTLDWHEKTVHQVLGI